MVQGHAPYDTQSGSFKVIIDIINPRRACATRVTVVVLCVCLCVCVCVSVFSTRPSRAFRRQVSAGTARKMQ